MNNAILELPEVRARVVPLGVPYAAGGVEEYWLVLAKSRCVECYSGPEGGVYQFVRKLEIGRVESVALPGVGVDLGRVFPAGALL